MGHRSCVKHALAHATIMAVGDQRWVIMCAAMRAVGMCKELTQYGTAANLRLDGPHGVLYFLTYTADTPQKHLLAVASSHSHALFMVTST